MSGPSIRDMLSNWNESDLPLGRKLWTALRNNARKMRTFKDCCGNHGDPGC